MRKSIRLKLFISISCLILFFVALSWLLNTQYLKSYYVSQKEKNLLESSQVITQMYSGDTEELYLTLEKLQRNRGLNITILDKDYIQIYGSQPGGFGRNMGLQAPHGPSMNSNIVLSQIKTCMKQLEQGQPVLYTRQDRRLGTDLVELIRLLDNGDILLLNTPLAAIDESTAIANRFLLFTGILTVLIGSIVAFLFARRFTRPILELNDIAQNMARLDFSRKYQVDSEDEIGELGQSINSLSDQLDISISELKEANLKLQRDIEHERKIDRMRKEFVSNVSHELRTPIALIQGYAEGLKLNVIEDEENKNYYCDVIMDETGKMNKLVRDLLDLSQIESGYFHLEKNDFDISMLVDQLIEKYEPLFKEKNICLQIEREAIPMVNADMIRIEQILVNYLNNALNHVNEKRTIKVSLQNAPDNTGKVRIAVFNSGKPIPKESLDQIWTSFYKVDKARTRDYGGTGLGLSIVKAIQELHNNKYGVINREDGVEFWFEVDQAG